MTKFYRNKKSGNVYPEFSGEFNQSHFPKDWELVDDTTKPAPGSSADVQPPASSTISAAPITEAAAPLVAGQDIFAAPSEAVAPRPTSAKNKAK